MESEEIGYIAHFEMGGYQTKVQLENWEQGLERACTLQSLLSRSWLSKYGSRDKFKISFTQVCATLLKDDIIEG